MGTTMRFGRKMSLPPTAVIKHQLRMIAVTDSLIGSLQDEDLSSQDKTSELTKIIARNKLSAEASRLLMQRLGIDRQGI